MIGDTKPAAAAGKEKIDAAGPVKSTSRQPGGAKGNEAAATELELEEKHRINTVAATFANLELQATQATLRQYSQLYEAAAQENQQLADTMKERDKDAMQVVEYLRSQLEAKEATLRDAKLRLERAEDDFMKRHQVTIHGLEDEIERREETIRVLREHVREATAKLDEFAHFEQDKQQLLHTIGRLRDAERELVLTHEKELTKIKFSSLEEKVKLRAVEKAMTDRFESEVHERAMQLVDTKTQQIRESNIALTRQKAQLEREVTRLTASVRTNAEGMESARREADLAKESHAEYAKQGCKLTRVAKDASRRVRELETRCSDLTRELQTQRVQMGVDHSSEASEMRLELHHARDTAATLKRDLVQMRQLTEHVLNQRSELEAFFYSAIEHTRHQQGKSITTHARDVGASVDVVMTPRVAIGYRGDLDARISVKCAPIKAATTTKPAFITQALTPRGAGTFLALDGALEPVRSGSSQTARDHSGDASTPRTASRFASSQRTLPHLNTTSKDHFATSTTSNSHALVKSQEPNDALSAATPTVGSFAALGWADKEKIIASLLLELNRTFYDGKASASLGTLPRPLPAQTDDEEVAEWGSAEPSPRGAMPSIPVAQSSLSEINGGTHASQRVTPMSAAAFPSSTATSARPLRPPQPPSTVGNQRISHLPPRSFTTDGRPPTGGGTPSHGAHPPPPSVLPSALRQSSSARSSAGSRRTMFATNVDTSGIPGAMDSVNTADPVVE
jgi:hypothetical protein